MDVTYKRENLRGEEHTFVIEASEEDVARWHKNWLRRQRRHAARVAAEMAECPYVACTCGHHEG